MTKKRKAPNQFNIRDLEVSIVPISKITISGRHPRRMSQSHTTAMIRSFDEFGEIDPMLVDEKGEIIAGAARLTAHIERGDKEVAVIYLRHLSEAQKVALRIAHDRMCENGDWDLQILAESFEFLVESDFEFDLELTGFEVGEVDVIREGGKDAIRAAAEAAAATPEVVELVDLPVRPVAKVGDVFTIADSVIVCGDATTADAYRLGLKGRKADLCLTDMPYNVKPERISGNGKVKHGPFVQGSGELSSEGFRDFVHRASLNISEHLKAGCLSMMFSGWYCLDDMMAGAAREFGPMSHMCIWSKTNGGMGFPWRNAWEGILVYRKAGGKVRNNIQLGKFGRNRTDVFFYAGVNVFRKGRLEELYSHPTCKPVALLKDAILDVTPLNGIVLDPFLGSGSLILAAHEARRRGVGIELDPRYVDVAVERIQRAFNVEAIHQSGMTFAELRAQRSNEET